MLGNASESPHVSFPTAPARARLHRCCFHLTSTWVFGCHGCCFSLAEGIKTPMVCDHSIYIVALLLGKRRGEWEEHVPTRRRGSVLLRLQGGGRTRASAGGLLGVSPLPPMPCGMTSGGPSIVSPLSPDWRAGGPRRARSHHGVRVVIKQPKGSSPARHRGQETGAALRAVL